MKDSGRGIPPDRLEAIFERFRQVDASDSREKGGTGLGLAIARGIIEQHGGRMWAESAEGHGSTFHFTLPLLSDRVAIMARKADGGHTAMSPRLLLVDDEDAIRAIARLSLERIARLDSDARRIGPGGPGELDTTTDRSTRYYWT